jgi:hypothetical protein
MKSQFLLLATILLAVSCFTGCNGASADSSNQSVRDQDLIIIDLSNSLTDDQRRAIPDLVTAFVVQKAQNSDVSVYPLVSDMGHSKTLVSQLHPPATGRVVDIADWKKFVLGTWAPELKASIVDILRLPSPTQNTVYTSCYIASAVFANQYFGSISNPGRTRILWVGDLIEDCPLDEFHQYRLPNKGSKDKLQSLNLSLNSLSAVEGVGAIIPRDLAAGPSDASFTMTTDYWNSLIPHLGMKPSLVKIGPADAVLPPAQPIH